MSTIEPFIRIHSAPPGLDRVSAAYEDPAVPGQKLHRCPCGRLFRPTLRITTDRWPFVTSARKDPDRCDKCQPR
jgi:hypothetical protein